MNDLSQAHGGFAGARNRGHVGVANLVPDAAHSLVVANETHIPITETNNTRNCA